ncbi:MAG: hypothetical protein WD033_02375 [Nitrosopumilaceae archaeon]
MKRTTVSLNEETKEQLAKFGAKGESFDEILQRVMTNAAQLCNKNSDNDDVVSGDVEQ